MSVTDEAMKLSDKQLDTLRHMLGINTPWDARPKPYRDYYCASKGDAKLAELASLGMVRLYSTRDGYEWYCCTDAGKAAAMASHKTIRYTKAKRVYSKFLDVRDALNDLTFHEFLTHPDFKQSRDSA